MVTYRAACAALGTACAISGSLSSDRWYEPGSHTTSNLLCSICTRTVVHVRHTRFIVDGTDLVSGGAPYSASDPEAIGMIISRTPFRVSLVGGGSDLAQYYHGRPGSVVSMAIKRYMYVTVNKRFD